MIKSNRTNHLIAAAIVFLLLGACSTTGTHKDATATIEQRAVERWNLLIAHQAEKAYDYLSPGVRATQSRETYAALMNHRPIQWKTVKFVNKQCESDRCDVRLIVDYSVTLNRAMGQPVSSFAPLKETWVHVKGEWFFLPSQ
ncbi:MAG: hypothetical protein ABI451_01265 [Dokdonella sp.]